MDRLPDHTNWYLEHISPTLIQATSLSQILYSGKTKYQKVSVLETVTFGRSLVLDGKTQSSEADEFVYHEGLVQPALVIHSQPRRVFIAGGGEGATAREVLRHRSVEQLIMVDLDAEVVALCREFLPNHHAGAFDDARLTLLHQDAMDYLQNTKELLDVIIIDVPDPLEGGPAYLLYTQEFYALAASRLNPGGVMVVQAGPAGPINHTEVFTAIHHTMGTAFTQTLPYRVYIPSFGTQWGFVIGCNLEESTLTKIFKISTIDKYLNDRLFTPLRFYDGTAHNGLFSLPKYLRLALEAENRIITKDSPLYAI